MLVKRQMHSLKNYDGPIHVWSNVAIGVLSVRQNDERFMVTADDCRGLVYHDGRHYILQGCTELHLIRGADHILVNDELRLALECCDSSCVQFVPAIVIDAPTGKRVTGYHQMRLQDELAEEAWMHVNTSGKHAWHFQMRHLFLSKPVAAAIEKTKIRGLVFSAGFSDFFD